MMSLFSLFSIVVFAAETVISPLASDAPAPTPIPPQPSVSFSMLTTPTPQPLVLGDMIEATPTATPTPIIYKTRNSHYTIALLGDSMIDTLGPDAPQLTDQLHIMYPQTTFTILNYGVGATNIDYGLTRVTNQYTYLGKNVPSLVSTHPDLVVVESFGYNPYSYDTGALEAHWLELAKIVDTLRSNLPGVKIVIAATIAPNSKVFGDGAAGLSFSPEDKLKRTTIIKQYLDSTVKFAASQHLPIADTYHASLDGNGDGIISYINGGDHIHYSDAGRVLFSQKIAQSIHTNHLFE